MLSLVARIFDLFSKPEVKGLNTAKAYWAECWALDGTLVRQKDNRTVKKISLGTVPSDIAHQICQNATAFESSSEPVTTVYIKKHLPLPLKEACKNCIDLKMPVFGAINEWKALHLLKELGIRSLTPLVYGRKNAFVGSESFLITNAYQYQQNLGQYLSDHAISSRQAIRLVRKIARDAALMHNRGFVHRDFYITHYLVGTQLESLFTNRLALADLHRAVVTKKPLLRNRVKDCTSMVCTFIGELPSERHHLPKLFKLFQYFYEKYSTSAVNPKLWQQVTRRAHRFADRHKLSVEL